MDLQGEGAGLGGGVIKNSVVLSPTANLPMDTLFKHSFVTIPVMLTIGTKVSAPTEMLAPPVLTMSGFLHNCKLSPAAEECASSFVYKKGPCLAEWVLLIDPEPR